MAARETAHFDQDLLQALLAATVADLKEAIPGVGDTVAFDIKHIFAWVRENNPNVYVKGFQCDTYSHRRPDCRLGVKRSSNRCNRRFKKEKKVSLFGYGTGVAACTDLSMAIWCWLSTPCPSMQPM